MDTWHDWSRGIARKQTRPCGTVAYLGGLMSVPEAWVWSWTQMVQFNHEFIEKPIHYDRSQVSYHSYARNSLVNRMKGDWLLMLDTDHQFEPDLVARMLHRMEAHDIDVLTGLYQYKTPPHQPAIYKWGPPPRVMPIGAWDISIPLFQVDTAGGGCLMVRRRVYDRIRLELGELPFEICPPYSEDHSFFQRCQALKIAVWVDTRVEYRHLQVRGVTMDDFQEENVRYGETFDTLGHVG